MKSERISPFWLGGYQPFSAVGYANSLNTTIQLLSAGSYTIYIEGEGWYGIGYIN